MEIYWTLGFAAGLTVGVGIVLLAYRNTCEHEWKFVDKIEYYRIGEDYPAKVYDSYQCSKCHEYKRVREA